MAARVVVVTGTGTGIGKTHFCEALLLAWGARARVAGVKPIETGLSAPSDAERLRRASSFHVELSTAYALADPVSPHLAAREAGVAIRPDPVIAAIQRARSLADAIVVELAGGLFTPLGPDWSNADLLRAVSPDAAVLVAPDRLGVLHDLVAATEAASARGLSLTGIVLSTPEPRDASTGRNGAEIQSFVGVPVLGVLGRATPDRLATGNAIAVILERLGGAPCVPPPAR